MLSLKIDNKFVDLPNDFSITMNLKSPIFGEIGSYSYPFLIPTTPRNAIIFNFSHRVESTTNPYLERQGEFFWNGLSLFSGTVKLKVLNSKTYEGAIFDGNGDFNFQIKNNSLQQYDFGEQIFATETAAMLWINDCRSHVYPDRPCAFPEVFNDLYFEGGNEDPGMLRYNYYSRLNNYILMHAGSGQRTLIVPMLYFRYVLEKLFLGMGYILDDSFFSTYPCFNKLVMYNSVTCNNETEGFFPYFITHLYYNYHIPRIKLSEFFTGIENMFNVRFFVNQTTRTIRIVPLKNILLASDYIDYSGNVISISTDLEDKISGFKLMMELDGDDDAFETQNADEEQFLKTFKGSVEKLSELPPWPNVDQLEIRYVIETELYYKMINKTWSQISEPNSHLLTQYLYADFSTEISTIFSTLLMGGSDFFCNCKNKQINYTQITPRVFFAEYNYFGDFLYVAGENFDSDYGSLFYNGTNGLFQQHFRQWLAWRMNVKLVKITRQMLFQELRDFNFEKKIMIFGTKYLVKSLQVTLKKDRIMPALLECYPCP